jgi:hypothetical protein
MQPKIPNRSSPHPTFESPPPDPKADRRGPEIAPQPSYPTLFLIFFFVGRFGKIFAAPTARASIGYGLKNHKSQIRDENRFSSCEFLGILSCWISIFLQSFLFSKFSKCLLS